MSSYNSATTNESKRLYRTVQQVAESTNKIIGASKWLLNTLRRAKLSTFVH